MDFLLSNMMRNLPEIELQRFREFCFEKVMRSTLEEKIQWTFEYMKWINAWSFMLREPAKSAAKATEYRLKGNSAFRARDYPSALAFYMESVAVAPAQSQELAFAYANRSALLITLKKHHECLIDINRALRENYPEAGKQKLIERKYKCVMFLQNAIGGYKVFPPKPGTLAHKLMKNFSETFDPDADSLYHQLSALPKVDFENKMIRNGSDKMKMRRTSEKKVSIVATANIKPGEILAIDEPVAWTLFAEAKRSRCANCFVETESLIPCPNCSQVMFCSTRCRENALALFHRVECQIFSNLGALEGHDLLQSIGPIRILLIVTKQGEALEQIMNHPEFRQPLAKPFSPVLKKEFNSQDLSSVFRCMKGVSCNDFDDFSSDNEFYLTRFQAAVRWLYLLKQTTFYGEQGPENQNFDGPLSNRELYVATLLLRFFQTSVHIMKEKSMKIPAFSKGLMSLPFGEGFFPLINLFSHSCDPHIKLFGYKNNIVCHAVRPIKNGEEITMCYYRPYYSCARFERTIGLKEHCNLKCACKPCQRNWVTMDLLPRNSQKVVSDTIGAKKYQEYSSRLQELWSRYDLVELADAETSKFLCEYLSILDKRFEKPCREFIECQSLLEANLDMAAIFYNQVG